MFTEDYLLRIINQALAVLMTAIGLRKGGKGSEASQVIEQAIEQVTSIPANIVDGLGDDSLLNLLSGQGKLNPERLALLADIFQEQGEIQLLLDQPQQGWAAFARALRFHLEAVLAEASDPSAEEILKIDGMVERLQEQPLADETKLALSDHYQRLLTMDDRSLEAAGTSLVRIRQSLARLQAQPGPSINTSKNSSDG
jgi:hypothetical protein